MQADVVYRIYFLVLSFQGSGTGEKERRGAETSEKTADKESAI